jgi:hypothetical protein
MSNKNSKNKGGRPWFNGKDTREVLAKLEQSAAIASTVKEACYYAEISEDSYYRYMDKHPKFRDKIALMRERPILRARQNLIGAVERGDLGISKWFMERSKPNEYAETIKHQHSGQIDTTAQITLDPRLTSVLEKQRKEVEEVERKIRKEHYQKQPKKT